MEQSEFSVIHWSGGKTDLHFQVMGEGPPLVFLHGFAANPGHWRPLCQRLAGNFKVIVPHLNPLSLGEELHFESQQVDILSHFIEKMVIKYGKVSLVGNSFGGHLAAHLRQKCGSLIDSVVLINPMPPNPVKRAKSRHLGHLLRFAKHPIFLSTYLSSPFGKNGIRTLALALRPETKERFRGLNVFLSRRQKLVYHIVNRFSLIVNSEDWKTREKQLSEEGPDVLILLSDSDQIFGKESNDWWLENTLNSESVTLRNAEHVAIKTHAGEITEYVREFLNHANSVEKSS